MIEKISGLSENILGFTAKGTVTADDYESIIIPEVEKCLSQYEKIRFLYHIGEGVTFEAGAMWDDTKLGLKHPTRWERMAIVTDIKWIRLVIKLFGIGIPGQVRIFHNNELALAITWINS